jgi:hypothetical protein
LVSSPHLGLMTRFLLLSDSCGFVDMGRPFWREDGSVFYNVQYTIYFTISDLRPGPCIYILQEQGGPVIPPGTGYSALLTADSWFLSKLSANQREREHLPSRFSPISNPLLSVTGETVWVASGSVDYLTVTAETPTKVGFCGNAFSEAVA